MVGEKTFALMFPKGAKLIHFYQNYIMKVGSPLEERFRFYVYGYEMNGFKVLNVITLNDEIITTNDLGRVNV